MRKIFLIVIGAILTFQVQLRADEGMWLLSLVNKVSMNEMADLGLNLTADQIYSINHASLKDAVGALDHGMCTAELVSEEGLLLTNHHCGYDEIQNHSSLEHDYLKNGFWAMSRDEELPNEGKTITFLVRMEEVTDRILPELNEEMSQEERDMKVGSISGMITSEATEGTHYEASVESLFNDNRYFLFVRETYMDVRLVGAPPESIGKFGGDTDNWMWPRHTGDFSIFRVYTGPDGKPAEYSPDNIPLKPKRYLPVSLKGYHEGDFTMVMGFPGSTNRYMTSWQVKELLEITNPDRIRIRGIKQDLQMEDMMTSEKVRLQYASKYSISSNYWKYSIGQNKFLTKLDVMGKKRAQEKAFTEWVNQDPDRKALYGNALTDIQHAVEGRREVMDAYYHFIECVFQGMETVYLGRGLGQLEQVLVYPNGPEGSREMVIESLRQEAEDFYREYNPPTDKKVMKAMIDILIEDLDDEYLPDNILEVKTKYKGDAAKYVDRYFKKSILTDRERFMAFLDNPSLSALRKDPGYQAALASDFYFELREKRHAFDEAFERGSRLYLKGLMEMHPEKEYYSDANSTMRLTYGTVGGYIARDAVRYDYYTTLKGVMEKEDPSNFEFVVEDKLKELYRARDFGPYGENGHLNVCFLTNNDTTGGNSGSPVINADGELIGLIFDGNWESMSGDVAFENELQKSINVDIRYVLFVIDKFAGADHLVKEMTLVQ